MNDLHLLVGVAGGRYAVRVSSVREASAAGAVTPDPGAPRAVLGIVNLRGEILPALDAGALLGLAPDAPPQAIVVIEPLTRAPGWPFGGSTTW